MKTDAFTSQLVAASPVTPIAECQPPPLNTRLIKWAKSSRPLLPPLFDDFSDYFFLKNSDSTYLACNNTFAELVGLACKRDILGKTDDDLLWVSGDIVERLRAYDQRALEGELMGEPIDLLALADQQIVLIAMTKMRLPSYRDKYYGVFGVARKLPAWSTS